MKLIAHGGYSSKYPENTLESYIAAQEFSPFAIEMDIVLDPVVNDLRCYHPTGISSDQGTFTSQEVITQLNSVSEFPLLNDVLSKLDINQKILIDVKEPSETVFELLLSKIHDEIERFIIGVRNFDDLISLKKIDHKIIPLALFSDPDDFIQFSNDGGKFFRLKIEDVNKERVLSLQKMGLEVWVTPGHKATANSPRTSGEIDIEGLKSLNKIGVDGILVNDIKQAKEILG